MVYGIVVAISTTVLLYGLIKVRDYYRYVAEAKQAGFKYYTAPVQFMTIPWLMLQEALLPLLQRLPNSWTENWLPLSLYWRIWHFGYEPFAITGEDTFTICSPLGNSIWTCDANVISQVLNRRHDFLKPIEIFSILDMYGPTFTSSEGERFLKYRKIAAPSFGEDTHKAVWHETIYQVEEMSKRWASMDGQVTELTMDTKRLALHILSKVFFDKSMSWTNDSKPTAGHKVSYNQAISDAFDYNEILFMVPRFILAISPLELHKKAYQASIEFMKYLREMKSDTEQRLVETEMSSGKIVDQKVAGSLLENFVRAGMPQLNANTDTLIGPEDVFGNLFIFILAGHETSANTLANAIVLLACHPQYQRALQKEVDSIFFQDDPFAEWTSQRFSQLNDVYLTAFPKLWNGRVGALMQETLRLWNPVPSLPRKSPYPQTITLEDGKQHTIPPNTFVFVNAAAAHRHPKYWGSVAKKPSARSSSSSRSKNYLSLIDTSISDFHPERWLANNEDDSDTAEKPKYNPPPGAYIPFSDGFRSCFGARFARIEFCVSIARIFAEYTVELVDKSPEGLTYAEECMTKHMEMNMGMRPGRNIPLQFVKRKQQSQTQ